jgi:flagellar basal-body rod modification protein FlgD
MQVPAVGKANQPVDAAARSANTLDKDAFLRLYVEQLKNQDPTRPQDTSAMIGQMAQFSILEQLTNLSSEIAVIKLSQQLGEASALIGKEVTVYTADGQVAGPVEKVTLTDGLVQISLDGKAYELGQIIEVK